MKKLLLFALLLGSMVSWSQNGKSLSPDYKSLPSNKLIELYKSDKTNKTLLAFLNSKYHEISEEKFMTITQSFWGKSSEMDFVLLKKGDVKDICTLNDGPDAAHNYDYISFKPTDLARADDITYTPILASAWDETSSCFLISLFDLLVITMDADDVILLTKGYEYIQVKTPYPATKPYALKGTVIVTFEILNKNGESKGFYDISKDPGL